MRFIASEYLAPTLVAVSFVAAVGIFAIEARSFRSAVLDMARHELAPRAEMAAASLREPLATADFRRVREFGERCHAEGMRLTVNSGPGGLVFDTARHNDRFPEAIYVTRRSGEFKVRLGLPVEQALKPYRRARIGFLLSALVGGAGVLLVFLFTYRQHVRLDEMRRVERFRRDFISDVSHELKTPLTGILGAVDLLGEGKLQDMIRKESLRLNNLVQGILSLSRLERGNGRETLNLAEFDLMELARETVERFRPQLVGTATNLYLKPSNSNLKPVFVNADATLISQALSNLVMNAIRHADAKNIVIDVAADNGKAMLSVDDDGVGIPADKRQRIFERFYRVDASRNGATGGSGLGLAIAQRIFRLHGGDLVLKPKSTPGCCFVATI